MKKVIKIEGMHCGGCVKRVDAALNAIDGVSATVDLATGSAVVELTKEVSDEVLREAVEDLGFDVVEIGG